MYSAALLVALQLAITLLDAVRLDVLLSAAARLGAMLPGAAVQLDAWLPETVLPATVPMDALLLGAALLTKVLLDAPLKGLVPRAVVASMPPASKLGAPSMAVRPTLVAASSPLSVGVSVTLGHPVAL